MKTPGTAVVFILLCVALLAPLPISAQGTSPIVYAVLFYSPDCPHCHQVITQTIMPLLQQYGDQLQVVGIDVTTPDGQALFVAVLEFYGMDSGGVPFLVIGGQYLIGSAEIPDQLPGLIEMYLAQGGRDWPEIPAVQAAVAGKDAAAAATETANSSALVPAAQQPQVSVMDESVSLPWAARFAQDPAGNGLAVVVLLGMLGAVAWTFMRMRNVLGRSPSDRWARFLPLLCFVGLAVAGYLTHVEWTQVKAVCGPVGDCNTVQQSRYARLWGILPIGLLGIIGYSVVLVAWLAARRSEGLLRSLADMTSFALAAFGTMFSIYLTFLEPFVIGATCAWCLTSSVLMTIIMLLTAGPAREAFAAYRSATRH